MIVPRRASWSGRRGGWLRATSCVCALVATAGLMQATGFVASRVSRLEVLTATALRKSARGALLAASGRVFAPVRDEFVLATFGPAGARLISGSDDGPGTPQPSEENRAGGPGRAADRSRATTTTTTTSLLPTPFRQRPKMSVAIAADRTVVGAGEPIRFTVSVLNEGGEAFMGEITLESHHPFWTSDDSDPCADRPEQRDCVAVSAPVPGPPSEDVHTAGRTTRGKIERGAKLTWAFRVRVNPGTPAGTVLRNHAHLEVVGEAGASRSNTVAVEVR